MSGPSLDDADERQQLYLLYAYAAFHGSGVGTALLNAVIDRTAPTALWVADPTRAHKPCTERMALSPTGR
jgi:GNAT superfamily N-acetyltransferase